MDYDYETTFKIYNNKINRSELPEVLRLHYAEALLSGNNILEIKVGSQPARYYVVDKNFIIRDYPFRKDLTKEGIEPNPGPAKKKKVIKLKLPRQPAKPKAQPAVAVVKPKSQSSSSHPLSTAAGAALGSFFGPGGTAVGGFLGNLFGKITGLGEYKVRKNSLMTDNGPPVFQSQSAGTMITHREFLHDVTGSTDFVIQAHPINVGWSATFPWLSSVAQNYEEYRLRGLIFEFKTTCAVAVSSTNTAMGTVIMATDYNVLNSAFTNKQQMEAYEFCTSTVPFNSMIHPVECSPQQNVLSTLYIRDTSTILSANSDLRFYDIGTMYLATVGMQAAATIGELWVSYHVELLKPRLPPLFVPSSGMIYNQQVYSTDISVINGNLTYQYLVGEASAISPGAHTKRSLPSNALYLDDTNHKLGFYGSGTYLVFMDMQISGTPTITTPFDITVTDGDKINAAGNAGGSDISSVYHSDAAGQSRLILIRSNSSVNYMEISFSGSATSSSSIFGTSLWVIGIPDIPYNVSSPLTLESLLARLIKLEKPASNSECKSSWSIL